MRVLAIRTDFIHHGEHAGYKQILKFVRPSVTLGRDEQSGLHLSDLRARYQWIFEWDARKHRHQVDLVHILYGEDYFRFSPWLLGDLPIVATFHQPAEMLEREIMRGDLRGRIGRLTHLITQNRFSRLAAAIVTEENQKRVLSKVMPAERIHVIPLGVHLGRFREAYQRFQQEQRKTDGMAILTVGNWLRDWEFLRDTALRAATAHPHWHFHVVNRGFDTHVKELLAPLGNVTLHEALSDDALMQRLFTARVLYIPVTSASGNNALLEAMAMGLPVVMTDVFGGKFMIPEPAVRLYERDDLSSAIQKLGEVMDLPEEEYAALKATTFAAASAFDWEAIARRTMEVYQMALTK